MTSEPVLKGSCQCGAVQYSSATLPSELTHCHCKTCRKLSGAPYITFGKFARASITWTSGEASLKKTSYSDLARRAHCSNCGSHIYMQYNCQPDYMSFAAGSFDEERVQGELPAVGEHIFVGEGSKAIWDVLPDDQIPRYPEFPSSFQKKLDDWKKSKELLVQVELATQCRGTERYS